MTTRISEAGHLVRRFFGHLRARPLSPREQDIVRDALPGELSALFYRQASADQRHALVVAMRVRDRRPGDADAFVAALVHDVGKAEVAIGAVSRSLATVFEALRLPMPHRWRTYRAHGTNGAAALEAAGAPLLAVAFARHHPGPPPAAIDGEAWSDLAAADHT